MADKFLRLAKITGESRDIDHETEIEVLDWSWGLINDASFDIRDARAGQAHTSVAHLSIDKMLDNASVPLVQYCAQGTHIDDAVLVCRKNTGDKSGGSNTRQNHVDEFWKIELTDLKVLSVKWPGKCGADCILETVEFSFLKFNIIYKMQTQEGNMVGARQFPFSIPEQKVVTK